MNIKIKETLLILLCLLVILPDTVFSFSPGDLEIIFDFKNNQCFYNGKIEKLQPGSTGEIKIKMINIDKNLQYTINIIDEKKKPANLKFYYNGKDFISLSNLSSELNGLINSGKDPELIVTYLWEYETGDTYEDILENDKVDSSFANLTYSFSMTLNAEEPKPQSKEEKETIKEKQDDNKKEEKNEINVEKKEENKTVSEKIKEIFVGMLPRTGIDINLKEILIMFILLLVGVLGIVFLVIKYKREKIKEKEENENK